MNSKPGNYVPLVEADEIDADVEQIFNEILRVREIIRFARRCARTPYAVTEEDYEMVRNYGISDEEIVEIVSLAAVGNYFDTLADALKLETDSFYKEGLPAGQLVG